MVQVQWSVKHWMMYNKFMNMNKVLILFSLIVLIMLSCGRAPEDTGRTFVPDMQYSSAYEPYAPGPNVEGSSLNDGLSAREPVKGTIPRGHFTYHLKDTDEDREKSKEVISPIEKSDKIEIKPSQIDLSAEINKIGKYDAKINLHAEIVSVIHIEVVKQEEKK